MANKRYTPKAFNPRIGVHSAAAKAAFEDIRKDQTIKIWSDRFGFDVFNSFVLTENILCIE